MQSPPSGTHAQSSQVFGSQHRQNTTLCSSNAHVLWAVIATIRAPLLSSPQAFGSQHTVHSPLQQHRTCAAGYNCCHQGPHTVILSYVWEPAQI
eukprot:1143059-Pelagomonas_calceolata.AAC.4